MGVEDLTVKRLSSAKSWSVTTDLEQAFLLAKAREDSVDWNHLDESRKADTGDFLAKMKKITAKRGK